MLHQDHETIGLERRPEERRAPERSPHLAVVDAIARELLEPVWALGVQCSALRLPQDLSPRERQLLDLVDRSSQRMARALTAALDYVHVGSRSASEIPLDPVPCDLGDIAARAVAELGEAGVVGSVACHGEGEGAGEWDPDRLTQAVSYLVEIALAANPGGAPVRLRWRGDEDEVVIRVERDRSPEDGADARIDPEWGAAAGAGVEHGVRACLARWIVLRHGGALARFASADAVSYVAVLPRHPPAPLH